MLTYFLSQKDLLQLDEGFLKNEAMSLFSTEKHYCEIKPMKIAVLRSCEAGNLSAVNATGHDATLVPFL